MHQVAPTTLGFCRKHATSLDRKPSRLDSALTLFEECGDCIFSLPRMSEICSRCLVITNTAPTLNKQINKEWNSATIGGVLQADVLCSVTFIQHCRLSVELSLGFCRKPATSLARKPSRLDSALSAFDPNKKCEDCIFLLPNLLPLFGGHKHFTNASKQIKTKNGCYLKGGCTKKA